MNKIMLIAGLLATTSTLASEPWAEAMPDVQLFEHEFELPSLGNGATMKLQLTEAALLAVARDAAGAQRATLTLLTRRDGVELHGWTADFELTGASGVVRDALVPRTMDTYYRMEIHGPAGSALLAARDGRYEGGAEVSVPLAPDVARTSLAEAAAIVAAAKATEDWAYLGAMLRHDALRTLAPTQYGVLLDNGSGAKDFTSAGCLGACGGAAGCGVVAGGLVVSGIGVVGGSIGIGAGAGATCVGAAAVCGGCIGSAIYAVWNDWF